MLQCHRPCFKTGGSGACLSLPPLPQYPSSPAGPAERCRPWGEDALIERSGFDAATSGYARFRCNFDNCHPVQDVSEKYDGFKFPKPMYTDLRKSNRLDPRETLSDSASNLGPNCLPIISQKFARSMRKAKEKLKMRDKAVFCVSVFPSSGSSTTRHVYRPPRCEVFPTNNTQRTQPDGHYVLTDNTRGALAKDVKKLYRTSRYDDMYCDTTDFMVAKMKRDAQYNDICADETPTCCRVLNHPDPCHWCWAGGLNKDFKEKLERFQSLLPDTTKRDPDVPCKRCDRLPRPHKHHCLQAAPEGKKSNSCLYINNDNSDLKEANETNASHWSPSGGCFCAEGCHPDGFGPWTHDHRIAEPEEQFLLPSVYQFRMPSALHCSKTENNHMFSFAARHIPENYYGVPVESYLYPWASLCRAEAHLPSIAETDAYYKKKRLGWEEVPEMDPANQRNSWTFRDENNLRIPCISNVVGSLQKTEAQKRFHREHSEHVPDLRDFYRYSKRVTFCGHHASVFR